MREMDTESPVIWPAWCYSGEAGGGEGDTPPQPLTPISGALKSRVSRRATTTPSTGDSPGGGGSSGSGITTASASASSAKMNGGGALDYQQHNNNNNTVKNERLSPASRSATTPDNSSRSRSVTPSSNSIPGTPPSAEHAAVAALTGRNYSDIMRSLAAKYNNTNPNEYFSPPVRNGLLDPRNFVSNFKPNFPYTNLLSPLNNNSNNKDNSNTTLDHHSTNKKQQNELFSGSNIPLFPPMIDMSSTQALLAIVRQAKQDEMNKNIALKRSNPSTPSTAIETSNSNSVTSPLDLSAAGLLPAKRSRHSLSTKSVSNNNNNNSSSSTNGSGTSNSGSTTTTPSALVKRGQSESPGPPIQQMNQSPPLLSSSAGAILQSTKTIVTSPCLAGPRFCVGQCSGVVDSEVTTWTVDEVYEFVASIDICAEYAENFRDQRVDGTGLPLLTEDHLINIMNMKLGPALKLKAKLLKKMGSCALCLHCNHCHGVMEKNVDQQQSNRSSSPKQDKSRPSSNSNTTT